jgi:hypothetical protein
MAVQPLVRVGGDVPEVMPFLGMWGYLPQGHVWFMPHSVCGGGLEPCSCGLSNRGTWTRVLACLWDDASW